MDESRSWRSANTILYCHHWDETVDFYCRRIGLAVLFRNDWFVECQVTDTARLSIANEARATLNTANGAGLTLAWQVDAIDRVWHRWREAGIDVGPIKRHAWGARVFYCHDPEGHRIELWEQQGD